MSLLDGELREYRDLKRGEQVYVGCDTADGCGDMCAAQFFAPKRLDFPMIFETSRMATEMTPELAPILNYIHDETGVPPLVAYERAKGGASELEHLAKLNRQGKFVIFRMPIADVDGHISLSDKLGWDTNTATRPQMLQHYKEAVDSLLVHIYDRRTVEQLFSFVRKQHSNAIKAEAESNAHDDLVMASAIAYEMYLLFPDLAHGDEHYRKSVDAYNRRVEAVERGAAGY